MATRAQIVTAEAMVNETDEAFIAEQFGHILDQRKAGATWAEIHRATGIAQGTISAIGAKNGYTGDRLKMAKEIALARQTEATQAEISAELPEKPAYFETPTSRAITVFLQQAQRGRIALIPMAAGLGKTETAKNFAITEANVTHVTMAPSTSGLMPMQLKVLRRLGELDAVGAPWRLSEMVCDKYRNRKNCLLIIDEAQHLSIKALEEIRSWHDETGVGIALMGNEKVQQQVDGIARAADFAQLFSRIALRLPRSTAVRGDAEAQAAAWNVTDEKQIAFLRSIVAKPGAMRGANHTLEMAHLIAISESRPLSLQHLESAWKRNSATVRAI